MIKLPFQYLMVFLGLAFIFSCTEPTEGCLDIAATNFDVSADDECPTCCTYPTLKLTFLHQFVPKSNPDTFYTFKYGVPYESPKNFGKQFFIDRIQYFISNFHFVTPSGELVGSSEDIQFDTLNGSITVENNFAKVDRDIFTSRNIENFIALDTYNKIQFDIGLTPDIRKVDPESVPQGHPLNIDNDSLLFHSSEYLSGLVIFRRDTFSTTDSTFIRLTETVPFSQNFLSPITFLEGLDVNVVIRVDYNKWFENINLIDDSEAKIESQILENLPNAFEIVEILLE